jgi:hypothetical protein
MPAPDPRLLRFVRALLAGGTGRRDGDIYVAECAAGRPARLVAARVAGLIGDGVLAGDATICRAAPATANWLKRQLTGQDPFAGQHRLAEIDGDGIEHNLNESPILRLARPAGGEAQPFLCAAELAAGERLRLLVERAQLQGRTTMSYSPTHSVTGDRRGKAAEAGDMAIDARRRLDAIARELPADCFGVALDVCGFLKGLQQVEQERQWPRRSAKLVLRIALRQLARYFGLADTAEGPDSARAHYWRGENARPTVFE